jgi:hypothetical protein
MFDPLDHPGPPFERHGRQTLRRTIERVRDRLPELSVAG